MQDREIVALGLRVVWEVGHATANPTLGVVRELGATVPLKLKVLVKLKDMTVPIVPTLKSTGVLTRMLIPPT